ncbi:MAG: dehydrogenase E1 component subunit alpha/beta [Bacteroidota bacterium]
MPTVKPKITYKSQELDSLLLKDIYVQLLKPRVIEQKMLSLLRQGKISKWFSGIGQEAISVGAAMALQQDEIIFTMHRNLGVFTTRNVPLVNLFAQWQGKMSGFTKGRDRSFHFGSMEHHIVGMISHLGPQLALADGVALAHKILKEEKVALAFTGDGATSEGDFHEALNIAAVWQLPVIFIIENNGYGLSTPISEQYACENLVDRAIGYGMEGITIDGNNILEVYETIKQKAEQIRKNPAPILIECKTFRIRGHEEASGTKYVPKELIQLWEEKDPIANYEQYLLREGIINESDITTSKKMIKSEVEAALGMVYKESEASSTPENELKDVFASHIIESTPIPQQKKPRRFVDAISNALFLAMKKHDKLILMGQDIADYGGVFKITEGFKDEFGADRVRNTPLCESGIIGTALGLSIKGFKAMVEMQFGDFVTCGFNQIVNNLAKLHYRWGQNADVVIRMPAGAGVGAGPFHSQTNEAWFTHTPGLKVVFPSNPTDAKGLLLASFADPNPVIYFEHKALYRSLTEDTPEGYYTVEIGKAKVVRSGKAMTIITYGMGVHWALKTAEELQIDADIIDLRTLSPIDYDAISQSVMKTNKVLILHEDSLFGGIGGELSAYIAEHLFEYLDAPIVRVASLDTPVPFAKSLEVKYLASNRLAEQMTKLSIY